MNPDAPATDRQRKRLEELAERLGDEDVTVRVRARLEYGLSEHSAYEMIGEVGHRVAVREGIA